jgi:hypothetical protein
MTETQSCSVCGARVVDLRRGRCFGCYSRWTESRPVGLGAACAVCNDRRRDNLRQVELLGAWVPMCGNCTVRTMRLDPMPRTVDGIRHELARERRRGDRRSGARVAPGHAERRGLERRSVGHAYDGDLLLVDIELTPPTPATPA